MKRIDYSYIDDLIVFSFPSNPDWVSNLTDGNYRNKSE